MDGALENYLLEILLNVFFLAYLYEGPWKVSLRQLLIINHWRKRRYIGNQKLEHKQESGKGNRNLSNADSKLCVFSSGGGNIKSSLLDV